MRTRWLWPAFTTGIVVNGLRLRRRVGAIPVLEWTDQAEAPTHRFVTAAGVSVDDATVRAASRYASSQGLDAVDLVPFDMPVERLLDLVRLVDPRTYRDDPLIPGRGAGQALLVSDDLVRRLGLEQVDGLDPLAMLQLTAEIKRCAPRSTDLALSPWLRAGPEDPGSDLACLEAIFTFGTPVVVGTKAAELALLARGALSRRPAALAAVAAHSVQPLLAVGGTAASPRDLPARASRRLTASMADLARAVVARGPARPDDELERRRAAYDDQLSGGVARFFEPARPDCPICGSDRLSRRVEVPDMLQCKPGTFRLDECGGCGHIFQNPRLTPEGLDFYYQDFYDGLGDEQTELLFSTGVESYRGRAELLDGISEPRRWLDVGAGHGHFCLIARETWPKTHFDGLDMSDSIDVAERRGWIDRGHRGFFPDLADDLAGQYDVVSMHHYLEHTRDPAAELDAARTALEPGGLLLIELPDPSSRLGRLLGRYWGPWFQPQHQHFLSVERLEALLHDRGFSTVACQRGEPHQPCDFVFGLYLLINRLAPPTDVPWLPRPGLLARFRRAAAFVVAAPALVAALLFDRAISPLAQRHGASNTFRLLTRAPGPAAQDGVGDGT